MTCCRTLTPWQDLEELFNKLKNQADPLQGRSLFSEVKGVLADAMKTPFPDLPRFF